MVGPNHPKCAESRAEMREARAVGPGALAAEVSTRPSLLGPVDQTARFFSLRRSRSESPPQMPNRSSFISADSRHSVRTSQVRQTFFASLVDPPFSGKNASGSVCAQRARSCPPASSASSSEIRKSSLTAALPLFSAHSTLESNVWTSTRSPTSVSPEIWSVLSSTLLDQRVVWIPGRKRERHWCDYKPVVPRKSTPDLLWPSTGPDHASGRRPPPEDRRDAPMRDSGPMESSTAQRRR